MIDISLLHIYVSGIQFSLFTYVSGYKLRLYSIIFTMSRNNA